MHTLVVEDDAALAETLQIMLEVEGFNVTVANRGDEAIDLIRFYDYDLCTLDLNLPDMSGFEVIRTVRANKNSTPIIVLSGICGIEDKVRGLGLGADDFVAKPFHKDELIARIHAIVRRSRGHASSVIVTGDLAVNLNTKTVTVCGAPVHLTGKEYQMLEFLSLRKGKTLSKEQFMTHLYNERDEPELKIVDVYICKLRKKLTHASGGQGFIETVWGRGFVLHDPHAHVESPSIAPELRDMAGLQGTSLSDQAPWTNGRRPTAGHA